MSNSVILPENEIETRIFTIRGLQVMLDRDLAELYGVETRIINQAVKRNIERFPSLFMFQLNDIEFRNWTSQIVMSKEDRIGLRRQWNPTDLPCLKRLKRYDICRDII